MTPNGNYEFGGLQEPAAVATKTQQTKISSAGWVHDRRSAEMFNN